MTAGAASAESQDGLPLAERRWAVAAIGLGILMATLDGSIANTALPAIARELSVSPATSIWVVNGFQLAVVMSLLSFASLGDLRGPGRVYVVGLIVFTAGSFACALSHSIGALIGARVVQGIGASAMMALAPTIFRSVFPARMLGTALGFSALIVAFGSAAGPTVGGFILAIAPWPWIFAINVPVGIVAITIVLRMVPHEARNRGAIDVPSLLLTAVGFGAFIYGVDGTARHEPMLRTILTVAFGIAALTVFWFRQRRLPIPMLAIDLFDKPIFSLSALTATLTYAAQGLAYVSLPYFFQSVLGRTPFESGLLLTAWPATVVFIAPIAGRLSDRYPAGILSTIGLVVMSAGLALYATLPPHPTTIEIVVRAAICGIGFGFFQSPNNRALVGTAPREKSASASGILATARLTGQTLGASSVAIVLGIYGASAAVAGSPASAHAIAVATPAALWIAFGCTVFGAIVSASRNASTIAEPAVAR